MEHEGKGICYASTFNYTYTVKLGDKERFDKDQIGVKEPFPMTDFLHKDKEHLALRKNFRVTKKFLITKFECNLQQISQLHFERIQVLSLTSLLWHSSTWPWMS